MWLKVPPEGRGGEVLLSHLVQGHHLHLTEKEFLILYYLNQLYRLCCLLIAVIG
jgi:hypothetical protein